MGPWLCKGGTGACSHVAQQQQQQQQQQQYRACSMLWGAWLTAAFQESSAQPGGPRTCWTIRECMVLYQCMYNVLHLVRHARVLRCLSPWAQARDLAVPGRGSHPHADAFREAVTQCAKDLQRLPEEEQEQQEEQEATDMGQQQLGQGPEGQGQGAAEGGAAGANQAGPGAEMEGAGAGASSQAGGTAPAFGEVVGGSRVAARAGRGSGSGTAGAGAAGAARGRSGRSTARDWQLLTGLPWRLPPPSTEISLVLPLVAKHRGQGRWMVAFDLVARQDVATTWGTAVQRGTGVAVQQGPGTGAGAGAETGAGAGVGAGAGGEHLLGPARWRGLVLGQLGVLVRRVHETAWDRMSPAQRRALLREQLQLPPH